MNERVAEAATHQSPRELWAELAGGALAWAVLFAAFVWFLCWMFGVKV